MVMLRKLEETRVDFGRSDEQKKLIQKLCSMPLKSPKPWSVPVDHFVQTYIRRMMSQFFALSLKDELGF